uniref:Bicarbonate transporter-like transmembrane domain-containing protein n=1 Tax=Astyanax mexicanus TaxID=7994 RepID=A0A8B9J776_ASTMX
MIFNSSAQLPQDNLTDYSLYNFTGLDWSQLSKKECLKLGGSLVGKSCKYVPDLALLSFILFFGTYSMTISLKKFKSSRYFPTKCRTLIADFAIIISILVFCGLDYLMSLDTPKLHVPTEIKVSWFLCFIMEWSLLWSMLCSDWLIGSVPEQKGCGYHLDLFWVGILMAVCSFLGLPWEQRLTGILVFVLTGLSIFLAPVLQFIPMPVLYGVFLYMGVASLNGIQFWERIKLFLMPAKHQPDFVFLRHVPLRRVHLFTVVQITCLAVLWILKSTVAAIIFPVMILGLMVVRKMLDLVFSQHDLAWLDDILPDKDKKKKEDEKKKKEKKKAKSGDHDSDEEVSY